MIKIKIVGTGSYLPEKIINNFDLEKMVDTSDEWITERTGIKERRIAREDQATSDLCYEAAIKALEMAGMRPEEIDLIIVATSTPDTVYPSTACWLQKRLKIKGQGAFDVSAGCSGFLYAFLLAGTLIETKIAKKVLVCGGEVMSKVVNWEDRATCVLFGDGAGACVIVESNGESGILSANLGADGNLAELLYQPAGGTRLPASEKTVKEKLHYVHMKGREVFKHAVIWMGKAAEKALKDANVSIDDIKLFIPHQANMRIIKATNERTKIPDEKTFIVLHKYGNMSAATIPVALDEAYRTGKIKDGDLILMSAFGTGFTWAGMVYKW
ncbi:MAG: beta-ketoacyl-ACP synthase III [candidate division WOR-3 bacterium]|uniref:Beta-ketoacyl-[acyl-carrier-protein] synthase III n=1 Tax=candidate division WOR-3 bacterium TaxID=2052148 RepID=A0A7C4S1V5_UNCW3